MIVIYSISPEIITMKAPLSGIQIIGKFQKTPLFFSSQLSFVKFLLICNYLAQTIFFFIVLIIQE